MSIVFDVPKFSLENKYRIKWGPYNNKVTPLHRLSAIQKEVIERMCTLRYCTRDQLALQLKNKNVRKGKQLVKQLTHMGFLQEHTLQSGIADSTTSFYSVSKPVLEQLHMEVPTKRDTIHTVLSYLIAAQFFLHFYRSCVQVEIKEDEKPFLQSIRYGENEYKVVSLRSRLDVSEFFSYIKYNENTQGMIFVMVEDLSVVSAFLDLEQTKVSNLCFMTDPYLMSDDLSQGFFFIQEGDWIPIPNPIFINIRETAVEINGTL